MLLGTDTFFVRDEQIMLETFAAHPLPSSPK